MYICSYCPRTLKNAGAKGYHEKHCPSNPEYVKPWNKGLTKETHSSIASQAAKITGREVIGRPQSEETKKRLRQVALERSFGGYVKGSGRGRKGWYKGYWCDSSYELAWVIYNLDHNIKFSRNLEKFPYVHEGSTKQWIPDFILEDGSFVEIKGYETDQSKAKIASFPHPIVLLKEKNLTHIFKYVKDKYGNDFIRLYTEG